MSSIEIKTRSMNSARRLKGSHWTKTDHCYKSILAKYWSKLILKVYVTHLIIILSMYNGIGNF